MVVRSDSAGNIPNDDLERPEKHEYLNFRGKPNNKRSNFLKEYIVDYTANSNLHGLKYIGERERTIVEKVFWFFAFVCCLILCSGLIVNLWNKWEQTPVIVSFAENPTPVYQIPYPAVTVCFETKAMARQFSFTDYYHLYINPDTYQNLTEEERHTFEDVSMVCDDHLAPATGRKTALGAEMVEKIVELSPNLTTVFSACKWKDVVNNTNSCANLFSSIITEEGHCYTFNTLSNDELFRTENLHKNYKYIESEQVAQSWSLENGYEPGTPIETYPHRGSGFGVKSGLTMLLKAQKLDLDYLCKGPVQGFKILIHNPAELPRLSQQYFRSPLAQEVIVAVKPKMMTTSEGLRPYDPERRMCYFPSERYLRYFKVYTQANCDMECLSNFTYTRCGCVHFGMPHDSTMAVCNAGSMKCLKNAQQELVTIAIESALDNSYTNDNDTLAKAKKVAAGCKCLPSCTSIEYEAETSQADFDSNDLFKAFRFEDPEHTKNVSYARVMIFFKEAQFITSRRSELYGQTDFLANSGGLLGLFMGFSFLSLVEIVYFLTLRIVCMFYKRKHKKQMMNFSQDNTTIPVYKTAD